MWYTGSSGTLDEVDGGSPVPARTLSRSRSGLAALRREQLKSIHNANCATGWKVRPITEFTSTALGKEEMAVRL
jgi:hypothetical protein